MIPKTSFKEFEKDFHHMTGDTIKKLVMAKIVETPTYVIKELGLEFPPGQNILWGLLIFGHTGLHFFVHASESALATMFRNATNGKPPPQQYLYIPQNALHKLEALSQEPSIFSFKKLLPFWKEKPRFLKVTFHQENQHQKKAYYTVILEPVAGLDNIIPLLPQYFVEPARGED
jgi:hypothetical protein